MPRQAKSGAAGLLKRHAESCTNTGHDRHCDCPWRGRHRGKEVVLARWAHCTLDPRKNTGEVVAVLRRLKTAVDEKTFDQAGEKPAQQGAAQTVAAFIPEWITHYAEPHELNLAGLAAQLDVIAESVIGALLLQEVGGASEEIERWLNTEGKKRGWSNKTWNDYHGILNRLFKQATRWKTAGKPRLAVNPMTHIDRRVANQPELFKQRHLEEDVEDRLFAACERMNRVRSKTKRAKLTQAKADAIRAALAASPTNRGGWVQVNGVATRVKSDGHAIAEKFGVSPAVVSAIKYGRIWNPEACTVSTTGSEMKRRLIGAFDMGLRAGEMLRVQLDHVNWKLFTLADGTKAYEIALPSDITKGGATAGKTEYVYAATTRSRHMLEARRFQLKDQPASKQFLFGREDGRAVKGFQGAWQDLFTLAGLRWGRDQGLVWHTTRHEFVSRIVENTKDPVVAQELARHKDLETTQAYMHTRRDRRLAGAASLERRR